MDLFSRFVHFSSLFVVFLTFRWSYTQNVHFFRKFFGYILSKFYLECNSCDLGVILNDLKIFTLTLTLTLTQEPYENIEQTKSICRFFL